MSTEKTSYEFKKEFFVNIQNLPGPDNFGDNNPPMNSGLQQQPTDNGLPMNPGVNPGMNLGMNSRIELQPTGNGLPYPSKDSGLSTAQPINPGMVSTGNNLGWQKPSMEPQQEKNS